MFKSRFYSDPSFLVTQLNAGDANAFTHIYNLYWKRLVFFASQIIGDDLQAEDVVSDTFMKLWNKRSDFAQATSIKAFLYIAVKNTCLDHLKHTKRLIGWKNEFGYLTEKDENLIYLMQRAELLQLIINDIEKLPIKQREILKLTYFEELTSEEIAVRINLSVKTVRNLRAQAIATIQYLFRKKKLLSITIVMLISLLN